MVSHVCAGGNTFLQTDLNKYAGISRYFAPGKPGYI